MRPALEKRSVVCYSFPMKIEREKFTTKSIALCAVLAAMGTAVMLMGGLIPVFTYCSPLLSSLFLIPVLDLYGKRHAGAVWTVTALLSLLIGADKEAAFFYLFFGWYPLIKPALDRIPGKLPRFAAKTGLFAAAALLMYWLTCSVLGIEEIAESYSAALWVNLLFLAAMVLCMLLFDRALERLMLVYELRFRKLFRK